MIASFGAWNKIQSMDWAQLLSMLILGTYKDYFLSLKELMNFLFSFFFEGEWPKDISNKKDDRVERNQKIYQNFPNSKEISSNPDLGNNMPF